MCQKLYDTDLFVKGLEQLDISLDENQVRQFLDYYELLTEWNRVMNLTGITEFDEVVEKHFLDSLCAVKAYDFKRKLRVMDIGTGAGFPGIPLKIAFPDIELTLADSLRKRIRFLEEVLKKLGLTGVQAIHGRAEDLGRKPEYRERYDLCVSRAVAKLSSLAEYGLPFVKQNGLFIAYKSLEVDEEVCEANKAVALLGGRMGKLVKFTLPNSNAGRSFVLIQKIKPTPKRYPRNAGTPEREPIR